MGRRDRALVLALVVGAWAGSGCAAKAPPELAHPPAAPSPPVVDVAPPPRVDVPPPLAPPAPLEVKVLQRGEARVATGPAHGRWGVVVELTWPRRSVLTMTLDSASVVARTQTGERLPATTMFFINPDPKVVAASPIGSNILCGSAITVGSETYEHAEGEIENPRT